MVVIPHLVIVFFSDDSSSSGSRCSNSSPLVGQSLSRSNHCSGDNIRDAEDVFELITEAQVDAFLEIAEKIKL